MEQYSQKKIHIRLCTKSKMEIFVNVRLRANRYVGVDCKIELRGNILKATSTYILIDTKEETFLISHFHILILK
jgi:hypothetical protein